MFSIEITHGKSKKSADYDVSGLENWKVIKSEDREDLILEIIQKNENIKHTHVIKVAYHCAKIPKKTVEEILKRLERDFQIEAIKDERFTNGEKKWRLIPFAIAPEKEILVDLRKSFDNYELEFRELQKELQSKKITKTEKANLILKMLDALFFYDWEILKTNSLVRSMNIEDFHSQILNYKKKLMKLAFDDPDGTMFVEEYILSKLQNRV